MTKEMMHIDENMNIYFDCRSHAGKTDVCIMCSTLCNVLIVACSEYGIEPKDDKDGHLSFDIEKAPSELVRIFGCVQKVFNAVGSQFPDHLMVY